MQRIRGRLLLSYILLVLITVGAIGLSFLLILNSRPAPLLPTYQRLAAVALSLDPTEIVVSNLRDAAPGTLTDALQSVGSDLNDAFADRAERVLVVAIPSRDVLYDSGGGNETSLGLDNAQAFQASGRPYNNADTIVGTFRQDAQEWAYVGVNLVRFRGEEVYLLLAEPRPTQTLGEALADFGTEVFPLLAQAALISLVIAVALALLFSRSVARPLQKMAAAALEIAGGRYEQRIPVEGPREVRDVGMAFNRMVDQVQDEQRSQQDFLANVSHDLKTPLTSIQGYSQAIIDGAAPDTVKAATIIYDEAARLNRMVVELTDLARLQAGRLSMQFSAIDLGQLAGAIAQRLSIVAQDKQIQIVTDTRPVPTIAGDGDRLAQVLTNLISNAIKYTPEGGTVTVRTDVRQGGVVVEVADTGIGLTPEQLPRIFERFYQVDKARGPSRGTGLGLAITQEIVQAHGGTITAASPGRGQGSTFTIWLPSPQLSTVMRRRP